MLDLDCLPALAFHREPVGPGQDGADLFGHDTNLRDRLLLVLPFDLADHHDKLVAAKPRHGIHFTNAATHPLRHLHQQQVAGLVPVGVVERLEIVQVDEQQRAIAAAALA